MLAEIPLLVRYTVTGGGAVYAIPFRVYRAEDVAVTYSTNGRTETALVLGKDYSVQIIASGGAELHLTPEAVARLAPAGALLAIASAVPATQEADLSSTATVDTEALETQLDREVQMIQQLEEGLGRAIKVPAASTESPEQLLADIFEARDQATSSATSAGASATAAGNSAQSAAGSAAIATEQREAACACAEVASLARDAAIAQTEAANTLMEAELAKINAIVAANKSDQQAAIEAARLWAEKAPDVPVEYDEEGNPHFSAKHWALLALLHALNPDGITVAVNEDGALQALGGNLLLNDEVTITESGEWEAPVTGWYDILIIGGGSGAYVNAEQPSVVGCNAGGRNRVLRYYTKGQEVSVTIGAGGPGALGTSSYGAVSGGASVFDGVSSASGKERWGVVHLDGSRNTVNNATYMYVTPTGPNGGRAASMGGSNMGHQEPYDGLFPGGGAAGFVSWGSGGKNGRYGNGAQGAVILRFWNPAKAGGPLPEPALFMARAATRVAAQPAVVNLYDPEIGEGSVWREEDVEARLAEGMITEAAWQEICATKAAEERAAWLASPDTETERFEMLRTARDARLSATDYLVAPDYPLTDEQRAAVTAYRQALRDLPAQAGAPWDGGGELTPWPEEPAVEKAQA